MYILSRRLMIVALAALGTLVSAALGEAETYRFRLEPFCNKVSLTLVPSGSAAVASVVGYDDNCGAQPRSPVYGTLVVNPDGGVTIGFTTSLSFSVYGRPDVGLQTNVEWRAGTNAGSWTDDDGNSGTFVFNVLDQPSG